MEITNFLDLANMILNFRKFRALRGVPSLIYSDCGKTFEAAPKALRQLLPTRTPEWRFNTPAVPWRGGWWERLVRAVKLSLKKNLRENS